MKKDYASDDRRGATRYDTRGRLPGLLKLDLRTEVLSLSAGGMLVELELPLAAGSEHRFSLMLEGDGIELKGVVRNCAPLLNGEEPPNYRLGVQFLDVSDREAELLRDFVERKARS